MEARRCDDLMIAIEDNQLVHILSTIVVSCGRRIDQRNGEGKRMSQLRIRGFGRDFRGS